MSTPTPRPVVAVVGTTASGKSALAHDVAKSLGSVSLATVDSMTVYRGMDIGTAKPTQIERAEVPYFLLDLVDPGDEFTVAQFQRAALEAVAESARDGRSLMYVGGTGLYGRAVIDNLTLPGQYLDVRRELETRLAVGIDSLYEELRRRDPLAASRIEPSNHRRIVRALEVTLGSGRPFSSFGPGLESYPPTPVRQVALRVPLEEIDRRIENRMSAWMAEGFLQEVDGLRSRPTGLSRTTRQAVGYRELLAHLEGELSLEEALTRALTATKRLARRQRAWFQRDPRVEWFDDVEAARSRVVALVTETSVDVGN